MVSGPVSFRMCRNITTKLHLVSHWRRPKVHLEAVAASFAKERRPSTLYTVRKVVGRLITSPFGHIMSRQLPSTVVAEEFCFVFQLPVRFSATVTASTRTAAASATAGGRVWNVTYRPTSALTSTVEDTGSA